MVGAGERKVRMSQELGYGPAANEADDQAAQALLDDPVVCATPGAGGLAARAGKTRRRVLRAVGGGGEARVVGTASLLSAGLFFGGERVSTGALTGVAVRPEHRPDGGFKALLHGALDELAARGAALALVHPSVQAPFRAVGFEQAGARFEVRVASRDIQVSDRDLTIRRVGPRDAGTVEALYRRHAATQPGHLDRGPVLWDAIRRPKPGPVHAYLVAGPREVEGYVYMHQVPRPAYEGTRRRGDGGHDLHVVDLVSLTGRAGRRLLALFADHQSLANEVVWHESPASTLTALLPERTFQLTVANYWMLRVVDVVKALTQRGYPRGVSAELHLFVRDPDRATNNASVILRVLDGRGSLEPGGRGTLRMGISGLAALYSGHRSAATLKASGLLEGPQDEVELAGTVFGCGGAWHPDLL